MFKKNSKKMVGLNWDSLVTNLEETERVLEKSKNTCRLSKLIEKGACFRCIIGVCSLNKNHAFNEYTKLFSDCVKNPVSKVIGLDTAVRGCCDWKTVSKQVFFTTCLNGFRNCKNCSEKRFKTFIFEGAEYKCCYGIPNGKGNRLNACIHLDMEVKTNDDNTVEVKIYPIVEKKKLIIDLEVIERDLTSNNIEFPSLDTISTASSIKTVQSQSPFQLSYANAITKSSDSLNDFFSAKTPKYFESTKTYINEYATMERDYHNTPLSKYVIF